MDLASSLLTVTIMKSWKLLPLAHPCGQSWLNKNTQLENFEKRLVLHSVAAWFTIIVFQAAPVFFFLSAGFARKWVEKIFCKKLHQLPETLNRCHGKLWQEGMFLFLQFYFGNQVVPILAITRLFHRHVPKQPSVRKQKNRFMYVPETYDSPVPFDSAPSQDVSMWNRLFFCYVIINHLKRQWHESCSVLVKTRPCSH